MIMMSVRLVNARYVGACQGRSSVNASNLLSLTMHIKYVYVRINLPARRHIWCSFFFVSKSSYPISSSYHKQ